MAQEQQHNRITLRVVNPRPANAWVLGVQGDPLVARRADTDYICGSCGSVIASTPGHAKLGDYAIVQYEAVNEYSDVKEIPGLPDYLQPYTSDPDYGDFFKPRYNIRHLRSHRVSSRRKMQPVVVVCYACGANNLAP
jgi:hypothetical protein